MKTGKFSARASIGQDFADRPLTCFCYSMLRAKLRFGQTRVLTVRHRT